MVRYPDTLLFINGTWRPSSEGRFIEVTCPATEATIGKVAHASKADLDDCLKAAQAGFRLWRATSAHERGKIMRKAASILAARIPEIAPLLTAEQGKPLDQSKAELTGSVELIEWFAEEARRAYGQVIPARVPNVLQLTMREPVGPVAAFSPWNFPISQIVRKLSAALAAGCSIILKAPEETPASPAAMVQCFIDAGLPAGVIGLIFGTPSEISEYLIPHPVIKKISFTGSTSVGKQLAALAGLHMKRVTMELGGHAPVLVFDDADIDLAVKEMSVHKFRNAGQVCVSPTRFLLQEKIAKSFTEGFVAAAKSLSIGSGIDNPNMGPLANPRRISALEELVDDAVKKGACLLTGGRRIGNEGWFFEPTVLADVPLSAKIMHEEPFGPIAILNRFTADDEAFTEANRLPYGLAAYGYTRSSARSQMIRQEVQAGMISINHLGLALPELPFGGIGDSGYGTEGGSEALAAYLNTRFVTQKL